MFDFLSPNVILWLTPGAPLIAAVVLALVGKGVLGEKSHWPCWLGLIVSCVCAFAMGCSLVPAGFDGHGSAAITAQGYEWLQVGSFSAAIDLRADAMSALMLMMIAPVSLLVAIFAAGYMHGDPGYPRFFAVFSLFVFSMIMLVLSGNFLQLFLFWEAVGLCSYLLIGFWYERPEAAAAAKKAFVVNRIGDFGLLLGVFLLWTTFGSLSFDATLFDLDRITAISAANPATVTTICGLLLLGAIGKSAQFPLHVWLPDAMEGPTPVSALIHAATMVTAGVYLVARSTPLFLHAPEVQIAVSAIGATTALLAALIALTQTDLKRVLAYSTVSQLGYMFMALGVGAAGAELATLAASAAMFHLFTHGFFKALLFLAAGSVMHAMGDVIDMRRFSGLRRVLPTTHLTFLCGAAALAGIPPLAGFWSKDEILGVLSQASHHTEYGSFFSAMFGVAIATAFLTAFYTFRVYFMTFWGNEKWPVEAGSHPHEASPIMAWPLRLLALAAVVVGMALGATHAFAHYFAHTPGLPEAEGEGFHWGLILSSSAVAIASLILAWLLYKQLPAIPRSLAMSMGPLYKLSYNRFYLDEIFWAIFVAPAWGLSYFVNFLDQYVIDGVVNLCSEVPRWISALPRRLHTGAVPTYAILMWGGLFVYLLIVMTS